MATLAKSTGQSRETILERYSGRAEFAMLRDKLAEQYPESFVMSGVALDQSNYDFYLLFDEKPPNAVGEAFRQEPYRVQIRYGDSLSPDPPMGWPGMS